jgi:hypothetical protein
MTGQNFLFFLLLIFHLSYICKGIIKKLNQDICLCMTSSSYLEKLKGVSSRLVKDSNTPTSEGVKGGNDITQA